MFTAIYLELVLTLTQVIDQTHLPIRLVVETLEYSLKHSVVCRLYKVMIWRVRRRPYERGSISKKSLPTKISDITRNHSCLRKKALILSAHIVLYDSKF